MIYECTNNLLNGYCWEICLPHDVQYFEELTMWHRIRNKRWNIVECTKENVINKSNCISWHGAALLAHLALVAEVVVTEPWKNIYEENNERNFYLFAFNVQRFRDLRRCRGWWQRMMEMMWAIIIKMMWVMVQNYLWIWIKTV